MRFWLCSVLLVGGTVVSMAPEALSGEPACGDESTCLRVRVEPGESTLQERLVENLQTTESEAEQAAGESLLAVIEADALPSTAAIIAARPVCYSALTGNSVHSLIMVPLPDATSDLDAVCHVGINSGWHAGGVAKGHYFSQNCGLLDNESYGGGYTSYVTEEYFEAHRTNYPSCGPENAFVCCSPLFPN